MYISMNWIKDFVDLKGLDEKEVINRFTLSTAEVEGIEEHGKNTYGVVVGEILSVDNVENSNKLHKVIIDIGKEKVQSICGAPNVKVGQKIVVAPYGSMVQGIEIKKSTLCGLDSCAVCLSEKELGISDDHSGIMVLDEDTLVGTDIKKLIPLEDIVFEVDNKSLTNRPDLWGHYGIAREFSALTGRTLKPLEIVDIDKYNNLPKIDIKVLSDKCYRYSSISVENVTRKISSYEMKTRLFYCGMRPINMLADITNYIMMELGQPMHAFDKSLVSNITVKMLDKDYEFKTLDGNIRNVDTNTLMICNENTPVAIAGIMGGENTEIKDTTNSLLLESATFDPVSIRKSTTRLGLRTDAATRYEKTLDPELTVLAIKRYLKLLMDMDNGVQVTSSLTDVYTKKYDSITIDVDASYISKRIGQKIETDEIEKILTSLCFEVERNGDSFKVTVPSYRATKDVTNKADIVEEVSRIYGYDKILPKTTFAKIEPVKEDATRALDYDIKKLLAEKYDMNEVHSYVWYDTKLNNELNIKTHDNIKIVNSLNAEDSVLRYNMAPTMLNIVFNNLKNFDECNIFEIGHVFNYDLKEEPVKESKTLGMALASQTLDEAKLLFKLKDIIQTICMINKNIQVEFVQNDTFKDNFIHPVNSFKILYKDKVLGYIALVHPVVKDKISKKSSIVISELFIEELSNISKVDKVYNKFTKYQTVNVDLSLIVENTYIYANIEKIIKNTKLDYLQGYKLIDIYEDELKLGNKKSITLRFELASFDKTLTSEEINDTIDKLIETFEANGIIIRK